MRSYCWHAEVENQLPNRGTRTNLDHEDSDEALSRYTRGITRAMAENKHATTWVGLILQWGTGARGRSAEAFIEDLAEQASYVRDKDVKSNLDDVSENTNPDEVLADNF